MKAGQEPVERPRRRGAREGRLVTNVPAGVGGYICEQAEELGVAPSTFSRMLIIEALKARGLTVKDLDAKYGIAYAEDKRLKREVVQDSETGAFVADNDDEKGMEAPAA